MKTKEVIKHLPLEERVREFASAYVKTEKIWQVVDGKLKGFWIGRLCGVAISDAQNNWHFETEDEAQAAAVSFRQMCRDELAVGEINTTCSRCGTGIKVIVGQPQTICQSCGFVEAK